MKIPKTDTWPRQEFLNARQLQHEDSLNRHKNKENYIIIYPGSLIICDSCDDEILTEYVNLVHYGRRVACDKCLPNWK